MKEFVFNYKVRPANLVILGLTNIYRSMIGMVNIIFTLSMGLVAFRFWFEVNTIIRIIIAAGIMLFPLFQPLFIYLRSSNIVSKMPENLEMRIDNEGITVKSDESSSHMNFSDLKSIIRIRDILILYTRSRQGFVLNKQTMEDKGEELYDFLCDKAGV